MKKPLLQYLAAVIVFTGYAFCNGYFFNFKLPLSFIVVASLAAIFAVLPWLFHPLKTLKRVVCSVVAMVVMLILLIVSTFAPMYAPGSREHNYVMYQVCWPALEKHYATKAPEQRRNIFDTHVQCEENVWAGRDPLDGIE